MFDCILPTTLAWQGTAFTSTGRVRLTRSEHRLSEAPLDARLRLPHLPAPLPRLPPPPPEVPRAARPAPALRPQPHPLPRAASAGPGRRSRPGTTPRTPAHGSRPSTATSTTLPAARPGRRAPPAACATPGRPSQAAAGGTRFEVVLTSQGAPAVRDAEAGEVMHPVVGAAVESERLYVAQSRLRERLAAPGPRSTLLDVGLGAGSNALAALRAARAAPRRRAAASRSSSFERELGALELAASRRRRRRARARRPGPGRAPRPARPRRARGGARPLAARCAGDLLETLPASRGQADLVFWDPFSPRVNPGLWTVGAFRIAPRPRCGPDGRRLHLQHRHLGPHRAPPGRLPRRAWATRAAPSRRPPRAADPAVAAGPAARRALARAARALLRALPRRRAPGRAWTRVRAHPQFQLTAADYRPARWLPGAARHDGVREPAAARWPRPPHRRERWELPDGDFLDVDRCRGPSPAGARCWSSATGWRAPRAPPTSAAWRSGAAARRLAVAGAQLPRLLGRAEPAAAPLPLRRDRRPGPGGRAARGRAARAPARSWPASRWAATWS